MESTKIRIRKDFQPLTLATSLKLMTPLSPNVQVYNGVSAEYEPDRSVTATVILPEVIANCNDGSWSNPRANSLLSDMKWYANGVDISTLSDWSEKYSIDTVGDTRGAITIKRNLAVGETIDLHFEGVIVDNRLGINIPVKTDVISLYTTDKAYDTYELCINEDQVIQYNPFLDKLLLYDYKVSHGLATASTSARSEAKDENAYERTIKVSAFRGDTEITSGYTLELYTVGSSGALTSVADTAHELISLSLTEVVLDLRLITKCDFLLVMKISDKEVSRKQFSVNRVYPKFSIAPLSSVSISPGDTAHYNKAVVHYNGNVVPVPAPILKMLWYTDSANLTGVEHNEGTVVVVFLSKTGIGDTYLTNWLDLWVEAEQKAASEVIADEDGEEYTDENGEVYLN